MKQKRQSIITLFLLLIFFISLIFNPISFGTNTNYYNAPYRAGPGPIIDGNITAAEWNNCNITTIDFKFIGPANQMQVTLYLLHNGSSLFIGLNITQGDSHKDPGDAFSIYFDENNNKALDLNEPGARLTRNGTLTYLHYNKTWLDNLKNANFMKMPCRGAANNITSWEFEFISSYDSYNRKANNTPGFDVNLPSDVLEPEVPIGFDIEYYDDNLSQTDSFVTSTSNKTEYTDPTNWAVLICGRVPYSETDFTAIWVFIILVMILPAVLVGYLTIWIIRRKKG